MIETDLFKTEFIPSAVPSDQLMIVLHGKGDSLRPFKHFNSELKIKNMNYLLLNAPKKFLSGYSWYGDPPYQKNGVEKIRFKMLKLMDEILNLGWKPENIYLLGFSQGCLVSADLALHFPHKLGGVIGISGYFQFFPRWRKQLEKNKKTPWLFTHGSKDDILPLKITKFGAQKLQAAGFKVDFIESNKKHVFEDKELPLIRKWILEKTSKYPRYVR